MGSVVVAIHDVLDSALQGETASALGIIPSKVDAGKFGAGPILHDYVVLFEDTVKVVRVVVTDIFDAKVINNETTKCPGW